MHLFSRQLFQTGDSPHGSPADPGPRHTGEDVAERMGCNEDQENENDFLRRYPRPDIHNQYTRLCVWKLYTGTAAPFSCRVNPSRAV